MNDDHTPIMEEVSNKITNQNAREWVESHLFKDVKVAMKNLIEYI
jgi:hypothetical protein